MILHISAQGVDKMNKLRMKGMNEWKRDVWNARESKG